MMHDVHSEITRRTPSPTADCVNKQLEAYRTRDAQQSEHILRLEADLAALRSTVAQAAVQLRRLNSRYTVVFGPGQGIENAGRLYELLVRDARDIGQQLSLSVGVPRPFPAGHSSGLIAGHDHPHSPNLQRAGGYR